MFPSLQKSVIKQKFTGPKNRLSVNLKSEKKKNEKERGKSDDVSHFCCCAISKTFAHLSSEST